MPERRDIRLADEADNSRLDRIEALVLELTDLVWNHDKGQFNGSSPAKRNRLVELKKKLRGGDDG